MRTDWKFADYIEELFLISEIIVIPGMRDKYNELKSEVWDRFPQECEDIGLLDPR